MVTGKMSRNSRRSRSRQKLRTAKVLDRITYSPSKHKQKNVRKMRQQLMLRPCISSIDESPTTPSIKFGSFNVNGMDAETFISIQNTLVSRGFDVTLLLLLYTIYHTCRFLLSVRPLADPTGHVLVTP